MRRRRLIYRAAHRGTRELDLILRPYAAAMVGDLPAAEIDRLEALLEADETSLQGWLTGQVEPPPDADNELIARIRAFGQSDLNP